MTSHFDSNHRFYFLSGGAVGVGKDSQFEMGEATRYDSAAQRTPPHPLYAVVVLLLLVFGLFFDYDVRARWSAKVSVSECRLKDSGRKRPLASPLTETAWKQLLPRQEPGLPYSRRPHSPRLHLFYFPSIPFPPFLHAHAHAHLPKVGADSRLRIQRLPGAHYFRSSPPRPRARRPARNPYLLLFCAQLFGISTSSTSSSRCGQTPSRPARVPRRFAFPAASRVGRPPGLRPPRTSRAGRRAGRPLPSALFCCSTGPLGARSASRKPRTQTPPESACSPVSVFA